MQSELVFASLNLKGPSLQPVVEIMAKQALDIIVNTSYVSRVELQFG
jgi:hypothetical protein